MQDSPSCQESVKNINPCIHSLAHYTLHFYTFIEYLIRSTDLIVINKAYLNKISQRTNC